MLPGAASDAEEVLTVEISGSPILLDVSDLLTSDLSMLRDPPVLFTNRFLRLSS
jgi:hypothetical protein